MKAFLKKIHLPGNRDPEEWAAALLKRLPVIVIAILAGACIGYVISAVLMGPKYVARTEVEVARTAEEGDGTSGNVVHLTGAMAEAAGKRRQACEEILMSPTAAKAVIDVLQIRVNGAPMSTDRFLEMVTILPAEDNTSSLGDGAGDVLRIRFQVQDVNAKRTAVIAATLREAAADLISLKVEGAKVLPFVDERVKAYSIGPRIWVYVLAGGLIGGLASLAAVIFLFLRDDTLRSGKDVERFLGVELLGSIPYAKTEGLKGAGREGREA